MKGIVGRVMLDTTPDFKVGDPMPDGYIAQQEWAQVHMDAGLKQEECGSCCRWFFPHQLSPVIHTTPATKVSGRGRNRKIEQVVLTWQRCLECEKKIKTKSAQ